MTTHRRHRRTNAERTASTRAAVLDAAGRCLAQFGYAKTTTTIVAQLAGVSRGALLHHFPSRSELVVAAARHLFDQRADEVRALGDRAGEGADRADAVIEALFDIGASTTVEATFEVINAGRTDPDLRPLVAELSEHVHDTVAEVFAKLFPRPDDPALDAYYDAVPVLFLAIVDGLAIQRATGGPAHDHHDQVLELSKLLARILLTYQHEDPVPEDNP